MLSRVGGHIVNITTSLVDHPTGGVPASLAKLTKGGMNSATKALAIEYATRASASTPSPPASSRPRCTRRRPMSSCRPPPGGADGRGQDIVEAVLFLETAAFVTGEILHVDGGQSAGH